MPPLQRRAASLPHHRAPRAPAWRPGLWALLALAPLVARSQGPAASGPAGVKIAFVGDSLTEGLGVTRDQAYPALVEQQLRALGYDATAINSGVSGATSAGAAQKIRWALRSQPTLIVLALGANDMLRGLDPAGTKANLAAGIDEARKASVPLLLVGMKAAPNLGPAYQRAFEALFNDLAAQRKVPLLPFLLEGVAAERALNQPDGIHPNARGHEALARTVLGAILPLLPPPPRPAAP